MRVLAVVEVLAVVTFLGTAAFAVYDQEPPLPALDATALAVGPSEERWMGLFTEDKHVGYAMTREAATADGGRVFEGQSTMRLNTMGSVQEIVAAGSAVTGPEGQLRSFDVLLSSPVKVFARGEMRGLELVVEVTQGGATQELTFPVAEPPVLSLTLPARLRGGNLVPGAAFTIPYFDPITLANQPAEVRVESAEVLPDGETGWWITVKAGATPIRRLVDANGETLREEGALGMRWQRMTEAEARAVDEGDPPDLVAMASVPLTGALPRESAHIVSVEVEGVEASRFASDAPLQVVEGDRVTVSVPLLAELPDLPVMGTSDIEETVSLPARHPDIMGRAQAVVGDASTRLEAARRINTFVHDYLRKVPTIGVPNGLEVLHRGEGDCNEHTALYVSLARAAGIPSRMAAGLVWSSRLGDAFYYHAWPEVQLAAGGGWVPVDPTFGQFPADATHLKIVNGDLDRQVEIMGLMGKVKLSLVDAR